MDQKLENLSREELIEQADLIGVTYANNIGDDKLRQKIQTALGVAVDEPELSHKSLEKTEDRITIVINESETDMQPVVVGLNGKNFVMKRGKEVSVPLGVVEILNHAVRLAWDSKMEQYSRVMCYPYQVVAK